MARAVKEPIKVPSHFEGRRLKLVNGPSRLDLMIALFEDEFRRHWVTFVTSDAAGIFSHKGKTILLTTINGLTRTVFGEPEFNTPWNDRWIFTGVTHYNTIDYPVQGEFNTKTRRGWLEFISP